MQPRRVVFLDRATVVATFRPPSFPHEWVEHAYTSPNETVARLAGAEIAITNKVRLDRAVIEALPELRLIAVAATGVDVVDLAGAKARGVRVTNVRGYAGTAVAEHAVMLMLALRRNLIAYRDDVVRGEWARARTFCLHASPIEELAGTTLGVIGYGTIGRAVARLGAALGMRVLVAEHRGRAAVRADRVAFDRVIAESDVLSLHVPLVEATRGLIGAAELAAMKTSAVLINTARGGLVDEAAVAAAIAGGRIAGCGFDVLAEEPPRHGGPLLALATRPNVVVTPHVGWASRAAMQRLADRVIDNLEAYVHGGPAGDVA